MNKYLLSNIFYLFSILCFGQIKESKAIDSIFMEWNKPSVPGCALGIMKEGKLIYAKGYGMANLEYDIPNTASTVLRIGSTSKQFTAACIILLVEKGKLNLEDNLKSIFPKFPEYAKKITVKHLLNHTSGIRDYLQIANLKGLTDDDFYVDDDVMKWLVNQSDLNFNPGEEFLYSNSGYWLLGQIVNEITGMNMADFTKKEIFEPLKMNNTHFHNDHTEIVKNRASGYVPVNNSYKISMTTLDMIGDGGIFTTINDIKKWDDAFYNGNVLSKEFWQKMTQKGKLNSGEIIDYAAGLMIDEYKGLKTIRHGGAFVGFRAEILRFPEEQLSIAIFANRGDANPSKKANQVADIMLKKKLIRKVEKNDNEVTFIKPDQEFELKQMIGSYEIEPGVTLSVSIKNDSLNVIQNWNKSNYNIAKIRGNSFIIPGKKDIIFTFTNLKDEGTQTLKVLQKGEETNAERKKEVDFSNVELEDYLGSYYSEELDATYNFEVENDILKMKNQGKQFLMDCTIIEIDQFTMAFGLVNFERTNGQVSGFKLDSGRVKNLQFHKKDK